MSHTKRDLKKNDWHLVGSWKIYVFKKLLGEPGTSSRVHTCIVYFFGSLL